MKPCPALSRPVGAVLSSAACALAAASAPSALGQLCIESTSVTVPGAPVPIAVADMNADGAKDLVVGQLAAGSIAVLLRDGQGGYAINATYDVGPLVYGVAVGDLNGDLLPDVVAASLGTAGAPTNHVALRFNGGGGALGPEIPLATPNGPVTVVIVDLDGDGKNDVLVDDFYGDAVSIFRNTGKGTFAERIDLQTPSRPQGLAVGDVTGDGRFDIVTTNISADSITVFAAQPKGGFVGTNYATGPNPYYTTLADLDGNGTLDAATIHYTGGGPGSARIFLNTGGTLIAHGDVPTPPGPLGIGHADFDFDGDIDLVVSTSTGSAVTFLLNDGTGSFPAAQSIGSSISLYTLAVADLDGNGTPDVAAAAWGAGVGDSVLLLTNCLAPCAGDLNHDGAVDAPDLALLLGSWGSVGVEADLNGDGSVGAPDLGILLGAWGSCP